MLKTPLRGDISSSGLTSQDIQAVSEVDAAYDVVKDMDPLDLSEQGAYLWSARLQAYVAHNLT